MYSPGSANLGTIDPVGHQQIDVDSMHVGLSPHDFSLPIEVPFPQNVPAGHGPEQEDVVSPSVPCLPAAQSRRLSDESTEQYFPAAHSTQESEFVAPALAPYLPAAQGAHPSVVLTADRRTP